MKKKRVFSGIQPTGALHIGNYLGSVHNWLTLQKDYESMFCVVDLHAITVARKPEELRKNILEIAAVYLASGVDPEQSTIFVQSAVKEHTELAWILATITKISELKLMHQFKEKSASHEENINAGLFTYPVLMAADILLYGTDVVPVGDDQKQHLELARELARRFNGQFGDTFTIPAGYAVKKGARIMGLDDPAKKMSKSASSALNYISLTDSPDVVRDKLKRAVTDSGKEITFGQEKPAVSNLLTIYHLLSKRTIADIEKEYVGKGYKEFKEDLADVVVEFLTPFQKKYTKYLKDEDFIRQILAHGAHVATKRAKVMMETVKARAGLDY